MPDGSQIPELRDAVARACRILAMEGVADGVLGHVSVRIGERRMLIRGRGPGEHGLLFRPSPSRTRAAKSAARSRVRLHTSSRPLGRTRDTASTCVQA